MRHYWGEPNLFLKYVDHVWCVPEVDINSILKACHSSPVGGHHNGMRIASKFLQISFYCPSLQQDVNALEKTCM